MRTVTILVISLIAMPALADDLPGKTSFALRASTLGLGAELARALPVADLTARIGFNTYQYDTDDTIEGNPYAIELDLGSISALLDWRPLGRSFYLTGGVLLNDNEFGAAGSATDAYSIGGMSFAAADVGNLNGTAKFNDIAPYAGFGWNVALAPKTAISLELGVVFQGSPTLSLTADGVLASDPVFQAELERERAEFENDVADYEYYPVVGLGIVRRF